MFTTILWDVDNTLLDFLAAEEAAMRSCFARHGLGICTDEMLARYSGINKKYWQRLERGEITKKQVLIGRFQEFFTLEGLDISKAEAFNDDYQLELGETCVFKDNAYELLTLLKDKGYHQYAVTNGTEIAQRRKLANSGLDQLFEDVFISDRIGHEKPTPAFFDAVFDSLPGVTRSECLLVGDSLTSDIKGANNAGISGCWYNPNHEENNTDSVVDVEIHDLWELVSGTIKIL